MQFILVFSFITSCRSIAQIQKGTDLMVATAFLQKVIPGEEHLPVKDFLYIHFESFNRQACKIDSVYYLNKVYQINESNLNYELALNSGLPTADTMFVSSRGDVATVFYQKQSTAFYMNIKNIDRKETLYLP